MTRHDLSDQRFRPFLEAIWKAGCIVMMLPPAAGHSARVAVSHPSSTALLVFDVTDSGFSAEAAQHMVAKLQREMDDLRQASAGHTPRQEQSVG